MIKPTYPALVNRILEAYKKIDYRPNPQVYFDLENKECNPLVALIFAEYGIEPFLGIANVFNYLAVYKKIKKKFDWIWVEGFDDAFNARETRSNWKGNNLYSAGYKVGLEIKCQLKKIYFKKPNPK